MNRKTIIKDLSRFIRFDSVCTGSNKTFASEVGRFLKRGGFRVTYQKAVIGGKTFVNVIGLKGPQTGRPLLLCSHLDTVPPGDLSQWTRTGKDPWKASCRKGVLYGLGAADDKGPLLAMLYAGVQFPQDKLKRPLMVMGTFGEENGMGGAKLFIRSWKGPRPKAVIAGEPTELTVTYRHKGMAAVVIELTSRKSVNLRGAGCAGSLAFHGKQGHSSRPAVGVNALVKAVEFLRTASPTERERILGLTGGSAANIIPARASLQVMDLVEGSNKIKTVPLFPSQAVVDCFDAVQAVLRPLLSKKDSHIDPPVITSSFGVARTAGAVTTLIFDFRLLPGQPFKKIYTELNRRLAAKFKGAKGFGWKMAVERDNLPLGLDFKDPLVKLSQKLLKQNDLPVILRANPGCTEAGTYHAWGVPAVVIGPGKAYGNIHSPNESIQISQIEKAVKLYSSAIQAVCVNGKYSPSP